MPGKPAKKPTGKSITKPVPKSAAKPSAAKPAEKPKSKLVAKKPAPLASKPQPASKNPAVKSTSNSPVGEAKKYTMSSDALQFKGFTPYTERKGEKYMSPDQVVHFQNILQAWKQELMEKVDETMHHMQDEAANYPDPNDRASQESDFTMELRTRDRERKLIKKIEEALQALDNNEYGYCESCGIEIGIRRLEARPTATLCIDCKELDEIREKQNKG